MRRNNFKLIVLLLFVLMFVIGCDSQGTDEPGDDPNADTTPPGLGVLPNGSYFDPLINEPNAPLNTKARVGFSEPMDPVTVSAGSFVMMSGSFKNDKLARQPIVGAVGYDEPSGSYVATFIPNADLAPNTIYTVLVTSAITDLAGNRFGYTPWEFTTAGLLNVSYTSPYNGEINVALDATIVATFSFSEPVVADTVIDKTSFIVEDRTGLVTGSVTGIITVTGDTVTWRPSNPDSLEAYTDYVVTITTAVTDLDANHLAQDYEWLFTTGDAEDNTDPTIANVKPTNGAVDVALNTPISAEFTEPMNATALNDTTFIVENMTVPGNTTTVLGEVTYSGNTATFIPGTIELPIDLPANSDFEVTIMASVTDLVGNQLGSDYSWAFTTGSGSDVTPPTISLLTPPNYATGVAPNSAITAVFSELLDAATVTTATFILEDTSGTAPVQVTGAVNYIGTTATFTPNSALSVGWHTATLTAGIADLAGNTLVSNYAWSFTIAADIDDIQPTVESTVPVDGEFDVAINASISATFSEPMDAATITTTSFTVSDGSANVLGTVTYSGTTATFTPINDLVAGDYTATIAMSVTDLAGNDLDVSNRRNTWTFTTVGADITAPNVKSTTPTDNKTKVAVNTPIIAEFNESMDASTITTATFTLAIGEFPVAGTVSYSGTTATFTPSANLAFRTDYTATITTGATDLAGIPLSADYSWTFTTERRRGGMN